MKPTNETLISALTWLDELQNELPLPSDVQEVCEWLDGLAGYTRKKLERGA